MPNAQEIKTQVDEVTEILNRLSELDKQRVFGYAEGRLSVQKNKQAS